MALSAEFKHDRKDEMVKETKTTPIGDLGYGNQNAKIGFDKVIERQNMTRETIATAKDVLISGQSMVKVDHSDDGCIDGRIADEIVFPQSGGEDKFGAVKVTDLASLFNHNRYKLAGGGYITTLAMQLALEPKVTEIHEDLRRVVDRLTAHNIYCGLHTADNHGDTTATGCGACDKFEPILQRGLEFKDEINRTICSIFDTAGLVYDPTVAERADKGLEITLGHEGYFANSDGQSRFEVVMDKLSEINTEKNSQSTRPLSVCKNLAGEHNELFVVINLSEGLTFSQTQFTQLIKDKHPSLSDDQIPEAFVVDVPRIIQLAQAMSEGRDDPEEAYSIALYAGLSFQLAAAAELTDGSLENYLCLDVSTQ